MEKRESFPVLNGRKALFLAVLFFACLNFSKANDNNLNIFQDRDQDGLSDSEEAAYGTDPDNADSDGDGYSDGAEVKSGYNPLKPAPGDKFVVETSSEQPTVAGQSDTNEQRENLTDLFIEKIQQEKGSELELLQQYTLNPEEFTDPQDIEQLAEISLTEQDIETILKDSLSGKINDDQLEMLDESEIIVLPKPTGKNEEEIKQKEKQQIEQYFTAIGYIALSYSPVEINNERELETKAVDFINQLALQLQQGDEAKMRELQQDGQAAFEEVKKVPVPEVLKDIHLTGLSVFNYISRINPAELMSSDDPISQIIVIGKIQAALSEFQSLEAETMSILEDYGIDAFLPEGYEKSEDKDVVDVDADSDGENGESNNTQVE